MNNKLEIKRNNIEYIEEYDIEKQEIVFRGKAKLNRNKTDKRTFFRYMYMGQPIILKYAVRTKQTKEEKEEMYKDVKEKYGIDLF